MQRWRRRWTRASLVRTAATATLALATLALAGGCAGLPSFGLPDPASQQGDDVRHLWHIFIVAAIAVGGLVWGLLVFVLVRYRRRGRDDLPDQSAYNIPLEIAYTVVPVLLVAVLFGFSVRAEDRVNHLADHPDLRVDVVGFQWQWRFDYVDDGVSFIGTPEDGPPTLVLPEGETVELHLVANDVNHSFWVPRFLEKRDLIPGIDNRIDITPTELGTYPGRCAEYCGLDHWRMQFSVQVVSPADYATWLAAQQQAQGA